VSWSALPPQVRTVAERELTPKQLVALQLWENGAGYRRIGLILNISMSTARGRVLRARDALARVLSEEEHGHITDSVRGTVDTRNETSAGGRAA